MPPKLHEKLLKKFESHIEEELKNPDENRLNFLICPDKACNLFYKPNCHIPCEADCPKQEKLVKRIYCWNCKQPIDLPGGHGSALRIECECGACNYRMSSRYLLVR